MIDLKTLMRKEIKRELMRNGFSFECSWDELSSVQNKELVKYAKKSGYRKKYDPNCCLCEEHQTARGFYYLLKNKVEL